MSDYLQPLLDSMNEAADPEKARPMAAYMRDQFEYLGIKTPERKALMKAFLADYGPPPLAELPSIVRELWDLPEREHQYNALGFLYRARKKLEPDFVPVLEWLITTKSWWDTVDSLASNTAGPIFDAYPAVRAAAVANWRSVENIWLRRTTLLFQLKYKQQTDAALLFSLIEENLDDKEFFIQKAIGWSLREYSKTDEAAVREFVANTELSSFAEREALKWLKRREQHAAG